MEIAEAALTKHKQRKPVKVACLNCRTSHIACSSNRPCEQCAKRGKLCMDAPPRYLEEQPSTKEEDELESNQYTNVIPDQFPAQVSGFNNEPPAFTMIPYCPPKQDSEMVDSKQDSPQSDTSSIQTILSDKKSKVTFWEIHPPYQPEEAKKLNKELDFELNTINAHEAILSSPLLQNSIKGGLSSTSCPARKKPPMFPTKISHKNKVKRSVTPPLLNSSNSPPRRSHSQTLKISKINKSDQQHHQRTTWPSEASSSSSSPPPTSPQLQKKPSYKSYPPPPQTVSNPPYQQRTTWPIDDYSPSQTSPYFQGMSPLIPRIQEHDPNVVQISREFLDEMKMTINNMMIERNHYLQQLDIAHREIQMLQDIIHTMKHSST